MSTRQHRSSVVCSAKSNDLIMYYSFLRYKQVDLSMIFLSPTWPRFCRIWSSSKSPQWAEIWGRARTRCVGGGLVSGCLQQQFRWTLKSMSVMEPHLNHFTLEGAINQSIISFLYDKWKRVSILKLKSFRSLRNLPHIDSFSIHVWQNYMFHPDVLPLALANTQILVIQLQSVI